MPRRSAKVCDGASFDAPALAKEARLAGTLAIPFVKALTAEGRRGVARGGAVRALRRDQPGRHRHRRRALPEARRARGFRDFGRAPWAMRGRRSQGATRARPRLRVRCCSRRAPVPFGWKAAVWLSPLARSYPRFRSAAAEACVLQFGGPSGTLVGVSRQGERRRAGDWPQELGLRDRGALAQRPRRLRAARSRARDPRRRWRRKSRATSRC